MEKELLRPVLWDVDLGAIDTLPESFIMRRVACYGSIRLVFLTMRHYGYDAFADVFSTLSLESMDSRRYHYLQTYVFQKQYATA